MMLQQSQISLGVGWSGAVEVDLAASSRKQAGWWCFARDYVKTYFKKIYMHSCFAKHL